VHYAALLRGGAVRFLGAHGFWLVLGYDEVLYALRHPQIFSSRLPAVRFDPVLNEADAPAHTRVRRLIAPYFSTQRTQSLETEAARVAVKLLARQGSDAEFDVVEEFAVPLTEQLMGSLLGFSFEETEDLRRGLVAHKHRLDGAVYRVLEDWLRAYLTQMRERPRENMCSRLLRDEAEAALTPDEIIAVLKLLWVAGTTTTSRLISASALLLLRHTQVRAALQGDENLLTPFVEEAVRLEPSEQMVWRVAREDVELAGATIPAGADVRLCLAAANRDPKHFAEPDRLSLERSPNNHLSFGFGPHYCIGAAMGRMLARVALGALLREWPDFKAARPLDELSYEESFSSRALEHLFVMAA
jgi:cytochrome P450